MAKIFDMHAHAFPGKIAEKAVLQLERFYNLKIPYPADLQSLLASADEAGVDKLVIQIAATKPEQVEVSNNWLAGLVSDRIVGFGSIHPDYREFARELDRMAELGLRGIKFHSELQGFALDDPRLWPIYEAIDDRFVVMFHMGDASSILSKPRKLAKVLDAFPRLRAVAAHLGGYQSWLEAEQYLYGRDLYIDTSSALWCMEPAEAARLIKAHGVDRVVFGSDYPIATHREELARLHELPLSARDKERILWDNAMQLMGFNGGIADEKNSSSSPAAGGSISR